MTVVDSSTQRKKQAYMFATTFEMMYVHKLIKATEPHKIQMKRNISVYRNRYMKERNADLCPIAAVVEAIPHFVPKPPKECVTVQEQEAYCANFVAWGQQIIDEATYKVLYENVFPNDHILAMKVGEEKHMSLYTLRIIRQDEQGISFAFNLTDYLYTLMNWQLKCISMKPYNNNVTMLPVSANFFVEKPLKREIMMLGERLFGNPFAFTHSVVEL